MKLRNKKTGEIKDWSFAMLQNVMQSTERKHYNSLAELNEEWCDYEEPKGYWFVDSLGDVYKHTKDSQALDIEQTAVEDWHLNIGNHFETKEEAEKAVEKLKAWKRLKDKGFKFEWWDNTDRSTIHNFSLFVAIEDLENINKDLDLLFGGEE